MEKPVVNNVESNEAKPNSAEKLKSKLSKARTYLLALVATGYLGQGVSGFNAANEKINFKDFKTTEAKFNKFAEVDAKIIGLYPIIETVEDVADFMNENYPEKFQEKGKGVAVADYDFTKAFNEHKSLLDIATDLQKQENGGEHYDLLNLHAYMKARELGRVNGIENIEDPIVSSNIRFHYE